MKLFSRKVVSSVAAGVAVLAFSSLSASAQTAGVAVFSGNTTQLTPVLTVGGSGTYSFASNASSPLGTPGACAGVGFSGGADAGLCVITAPTPGAALNTYVNIVCGTGTTGGGPAVASDTATISNFTVGSGALNVHYGIVFVAGVGVLAGVNGVGAVAGVVQIAPTGGSCTSAVTNFTATGVSVIAVA